MNEKEKILAEYHKRMLELEAAEEKKAEAKPKAKSEAKPKAK